MKSLAELGALRDAMQRRQCDEAERSAHEPSARPPEGGLAPARRDGAERQGCTTEREQAARAQRERDLFAIVVGEVTKLRHHGRAELAIAPPLPTPRQRELDERAALDATLSDGFDAESLLETDDALSFRRADVGTDVLRKLRRGVWAIQAELDLHRLTRDSARERLAAFLRDAQRRGLRCLRVVHGKGHGSPGKTPVLKAHVRRWLAQRSEVAAFAQARPADGGAGALLVLLRPLERPAVESAAA